MESEVEQEESIALIQKMEVLPIDVEVEIEKIEGNDRVVTRSYHVDVKDNRYSMMDRLVVRYKIKREKVKDYMVFLTDSARDIIFLCKSNSEILNTLFSNIIMLELSNWRMAALGEKPLRTIDDYNSVMFQLGANKTENRSLEKALDKDWVSFIEKFKTYYNSNKVIPIEVWQTQL